MTGRHGCHPMLSDVIRSDAIRSDAIRSDVIRSDVIRRWSRISLMSDRAKMVRNWGVPLQSARASDRPPRPPQSGLHSNNCHFCNLPDHYGCDCEVAADYIKQGKCKHNIEGRITLPSGTFIPRDIPRKCFKEHLNEWHHRNPGQTAAGQLMYNVLLQAVSKP
jgi:hypothetical protein